MAKRGQRIRLSNKLPMRKAVETPTRQVLQVGRNDLCPCGSAKKYKDCHESEGERFLKQIVKNQEVERIRVERQRLKDEGVPWYKRVFMKMR